MPELLQHHATPRNLAEWLERFTSDQSLRRATIEGFKEIRKMLLPTAEDITAAKMVLEAIS